jgi:Zn-finger nucleic acid-binding protein
MNQTKIPVGMMYCPNCKKQVAYMVIRKISHVNSCRCLECRRTFLQDGEMKPTVITITRYYKGKSTSPNNRKFK